MTIKNRSSFEFYYEKRKSLQVACSNKSHRFRHSTIRNLWAVTRNLICTAKHGTFKKVLEKHQLSRYPAGRYQPIRTNDKLEIKCKHTVHFKDKSFLPRGGQVLHHFFFFFFKKNKTQQHYSTAQIIGRINNYNTCPF